jgi:hypothetical protein
MKKLENVFGIGGAGSAAVKAAGGGSACGAAFASAPASATVVDGTRQAGLTTGGTRQAGIKAVLREAVNLRRDLRTGGVWRRAGSPVKAFVASASTGDATTAGGALPIGAANGGRIELFCNGRNQLFYRADAGELRFLAELPGRPILVETRTKGLIRIITAG